jgi:hypothetical protein
MVMLVFAIASLRAWVVNVNARLSAREIDAIRAHSSRAGVFLTEASPDARPMRSAAAPDATTPAAGARWRFAHRRRPAPSR